MSCCFTDYGNNIVGLHWQVCRQICFKLGMIFTIALNIFDNVNNGLDLQSGTLDVNIYELISFKTEMLLVNNYHSMLQFDTYLIYLDLHARLQDHEPSVCYCHFLAQLSMDQVDFWCDVGT